MVKAPAVIIIARHGARLDAADKQWHLTSPTPYDPPLTYGGWTQSRALGARIASLLHAREVSLQKHEDEVQRNAAVTGDGGSHNRSPSPNKARAKRRRHRIIVHSSPFLRCVQTSIGLSAGISQYDGLDTKAHQSIRPPKPHAGRSDSPSLSAIPSEDEETDLPTPRVRRAPRPMPKIRLRLDAFLGEWLSPDYYEAITPPPGSVLMNASAKAELLHRGESIDPSEDPLNSTPSQGNFPGGWGSDWPGFTRNGATSASDEKGPPLSDMSTLLHALPVHHRSSSHSSIIPTGTKSSPLAPHKLAIPGRGYMPPVPRYAISPTDPIPLGYVAHAREACVEVDYQWDSMRAPQDWGDGGEYGEEWSAMHKRFRRGLQQMIAWYRLHPVTAHQSGGHLRTLHPLAEDDGEDKDTVLILVTHGAGCNALIGALTNQPVLLDVGMASLTMAVRKDALIGNLVDTESPIQSTPPQRRSSIDSGLSNEYDMRLVASIEHLRAGGSPLTIPQLQPTQRMGSPHVSSHRTRLGSSSGSVHSLDSPFEGNFALPENAMRGVLRSNSNVVAKVTRSDSGLWSRPGTVGGDGSRERSLRGVHEDDLPDKQASEEETKDTVQPLGPLRTSSGRGLWAASSLAVAQEEDIEREKGPKRRWTVTERN